MKCIRR